MFVPIPMSAPILEHELILQIRLTSIQSETIQFKITHQREQIPLPEQIVLPEATVRHPHVLIAQVVEVLAVVVVLAAAADAVAVAVDVDKKTINSLQFTL